MVSGFTVVFLTGDTNATQVESMTSKSEAECCRSIPQSTTREVLNLNSNDSTMRHSKSSKKKSITHHDHCTNPSKRAIDVFKGQVSVNKKVSCARTVCDIESQKAEKEHTKLTVCDHNVMGWSQTETTDTTTSQLPPVALCHSHRWHNSFHFAHHSIPLINQLHCPLCMDHCLCSLMWPNDL